MPAKGSRKDPSKSKDPKQAKQKRERRARGTHNPDSTPRGGRPSRTRRIDMKRIKYALTLGATLETAAAFGGMDRVTLHRILKRGRAEQDRLMNDEDAVPNPDEVRFVRFCRMVEKTVGLGKVRHMAIIEKAAQGDKNTKAQWVAAAWMLERRFPDEYGLRQFNKNENTHQNPDGSGLFDKLPLSAVRQIIQADDDAEGGTDTSPRYYDDKGAVVINADPSRTVTVSISPNGGTPTNGTGNGKH